MDLHAITSQEVLERISRHCPEALSAYLQCLNRANSDGHIFFSRSLIEVNMSEDFRSFRNNIKKLARENLLNWCPFDGGLTVDLIDMGDDG